jgi:hypothetical protein
MRYERSLCHAPADAAGPRTSFDGTRKSNDHFVTPPLWTSLGRDGLIHDQFVTGEPQTHDQFVTHSYS